MAVRVTVGHRLAVLSLAGIFSCGVLGTVSLVEIARVDAAGEQLARVNDCSRRLAELDRSLGDAVGETRKALLATTDADRAEVRRNFAEARTVLLSSLDGVKATVPAAQSDELTAVDEQMIDWADTVAARLPALLTTDLASTTGRALVKRLDDATHSAEAAETVLGTELLAQADQLGQRERASMSALRQAIAVTLVIGLAMLAGLGWWISGTITQPLRAMVVALNRVQEKDLAVRIDPRGQDETRGHGPGPGRRPRLDLRGRLRDRGGFDLPGRGQSGGIRGRRPARSVRGLHRPGGGGGDFLRPGDERLGGHDVVGDGADDRFDR